MKGKGKQETYWLLGDTEKNEVFIFFTYVYTNIFIHLCMIYFFKGSENENGS